MTQALKKLEASTSELAKKLATDNSPKSDTAKTPEATVLNFDKTNNFSRFLEASCDCC